MTLSTNYWRTLTALLLPLAFTGCGGGTDGSDGAGGTPGQTGSPGLHSLVRQSILPTGNLACTKGGLLVESGLDDNSDETLSDSEVDSRQTLCKQGTPNNQYHFNRIATFPVCSQTGGSCSAGDDTTAAEIVAASSDGMTLIYTNSPAEQVGFIDISNPASPTALGALSLTGEPTSVAVKGSYALVGVNTSTDFVQVAGTLEVIDINTRASVRNLDLGGQPDSVAVSPDGAYAVVVIENERDEDLGDGAPPQLPAGRLIIVNLQGEPADWSTRAVELTGLATLFPADPEPEYVDINQNNIAVVSLQENNHLALVDLASGTVLRHFSAGTVDLTHIDDNNETPALISFTASQDGVAREPDGVAWINNEYFATADEGDLNGGSRGFTIFNLLGDVVYSSGNDLDYLVARFGHYSDDRSDNKGNEPENVEVGIFGGERYLFVASERSSLVLVYDVADPLNPVFKQALPAAVAPEGVLAIPARNLLIAASEEDSRSDAVRSAVNIYNYTRAPARYPAISAADRINGTPIPWGAISGLAADTKNPHTLYAIDDSYFQRNRIFKLDIRQQPALLTEEIPLRDSNDVLAALEAADVADATVLATDASRAGVFDEVDLALLINADKTVNLDPEGIAVASDGGFWIASEGAGTLGDANNPINSLNMVLKTDDQGVIEQVFTLPATLNANQLRFGFEGLAEYNGSVYVVIQRAWSGDTQPRIAVLNPSNGTWSFLMYPLDAPTSPNGGWVGLSDITSLGNGQFLVVERDNQAGPDARIKKLYRFDVTGVEDGAAVTKILVRDLMPDLAAPGGLVLEKVEGLALTKGGDVFIATDNDGIDGSSGETQLINLGALFD